MTDVRIHLGERSYSVFVGSGVRFRLSEVLASTVKRVAVVTQRSIPKETWPSLNGIEHSIHYIGEGESYKSLSTIEELCSSFAQNGLTRNDVVLAVGGGMVTDVAGFAAASYHRGIGVIHVPTTLLAMIDAAIGGKTGVNIAEGKNLVGAFWQPSAVLCDLDALGSLPEREMRCGLGEMAKYHFIVRENLNELPFADRVARCVEIKGEIVAADEREGGVRAFLNYGHTLAHALEKETHFALAHGEAVALGILFAAHLAYVMGRIDDSRLDEHYDVIRGVYGLDIALPPQLDVDKLLEAMKHDKKALGTLTFVLDAQEGLEVVAGVESEFIRSAYQQFVTRNS